MQVQKYRFNSKTKTTFTTGDTNLDQFLGGGILTGSITELVGASGTGKSQLAMQFCLTSQLSRDRGGLGGCNSIYISTCSPFSIKRFKQIEEARFGMNGAAFSDNVSVLHIRDLGTQMHFIKYQLPNLMETMKIRLVVIDSFCSNFRVVESESHEMEQMDTADRAQLIYESCGVLKQLAVDFQAAFVLLNQVSANFRTPFVSISGSGAIGAATYEHTEKVWDISNVPALGQAFASCVNTRLQLSRSSDGQRKIHIAFSPNNASGTCLFQLTDAGLQGI